MTDGPLSGLRVLDLTSVVVGPTCTWRLGQYGAGIIKVEAPEGDLMRSLGGLSPTGQHSGTYLHLNRGKRNVCLDLKKPGARSVTRSSSSSNCCIYRISGGCAICSFSAAQVKFRSRATATK
jgi:crotonobetainyl-CoA:carnitine CoA-transferase CaiB-like acyl-CoA transferase